MLHISTQDGYGTPERVTPRGIARGQGDDYLLRLNRRLAERRPVYIRFLAEMNQTNNGYSAFDRNGRSRGPATRPGVPRRLAPRDADPPRRPARAHRREAARAEPPPIQGGDGDLPQPRSR